MVLNDLGKSITGALRKLGSASQVDDTVVNDMLKEVATALLHSDVNVKVVKQLRTNIREKTKVDSIPRGIDKKRHIQSTVVDEMVAMLQPSKRPYKPVKGMSNVFMMVGLQGSGKTTTCAKMAYHYARKGWRTALVCADTFRAGAFDQLKQSARASKIPFYGSYTETDPVKIASDGVQRFLEDRYEIIIVDTSGRHMQEEDLFKEMQQVHAAIDPNTTIFVMDSSIGQAAHDQATAFASSVDVGAVVLTKLDGHAKGGGALSAVAATQAPVMFIGTGEHREDLETFNAESFVSRLLGMGDIKGLFEKIENIGSMEEQERIARNLIKQKGASFRDLRTQYQNVMQLGPLSQVMSMLPGGLGNMMPKGSDAITSAKFKQYLVVMDSMNDKELDGTVQLSDSRKQRICRGAGVSPMVLEEIMLQQKQFSQIAGNLGKIEKASNQRGGLKPDMLRGLMPEQMMRQLGGPEGMAKMMKELGGMGGMPGFGGGGGGGGGGGMPNMEDLQKMMSGMGGMMGAPGKGRGGRRR